MNREELLQSMTPEAREALTGATEWRLMSLLLERPREEWRREAVSLAAEIQDPLLRSAAAMAQSATEELYLKFLGPGATVSPREVAYCGFEDPGRMFADIQAFYAAFSFVPKAEDPSDHIAVLAGFSGYLMLKEVYALMADNAEAASVTRDARLRFLEEHVARVVHGMSQKFAGLGPAYLLKTLEAMLQRVPVWNAPVKQVDLEEEMECGTTDCGIR